ASGCPATGSRGAQARLMAGARSPAGPGTLRGVPDTSSSVRRARRRWCWAPTAADRSSGGGGRHPPRSLIGGLPMQPSGRPLLLAALALAGCGGVQRVQLYEGATLPDDQVTVLWSNPRLETEVDRLYKIPPGEIARLHRIELAPGNHAV